MLLTFEKVILDPAVFGVAPEYLFSANDWPQQTGVAGAGRGTTTFVADQHGEFALRHYYRGGIAANFLNDRYLAGGAQRSRAFREWRLLFALTELDLPVPKPVAARYRRSGIFYRADLLTQRIPDVVTLAERLTAGALNELDWQALGSTLQRFHKNGVYHADLNAHNILVNGMGEWFVLDFDRGEIRPEGDWQQDNLSRLQRSLRKLAKQQEQFAFAAAGWLAMLDGYSRVIADKSA